MESKAVLHSASDASSYSTVYSVILCMRHSEQKEAETVMHVAQVALKCDVKLPEESMMFFFLQYAHVHTQAWQLSQLALGNTAC